MRDALADQASGLRALFGRRARTTLSVAGDGATAVTLRRSEALALAHAPMQSALVVVEMEDDGGGIPLVVRDPVRDVGAFEAWGVTVRVG